MDLVVGQARVPQERRLRQRHVKQSQLQNWARGRFSTLGCEPSDMLDRVLSFLSRELIKLRNLPVGWVQVIRIYIGRIR